MQRLINYIENYVSLDKEAVSILNNYCFFEKVAKNDNILVPGQYCNTIWFLASGMVRKYFLHDGKEMTCWIHTENDIFTSLNSYTQKCPAKEYIQACEESVLIGITRDNALQLNNNKSLQYFSKQILEQGMANIDLHAREFAVRDAKGKYEYLCQIVPEAVKRAKLGHIATILGITQETLSRIRKL